MEMTLWDYLRKEYSKKTKMPEWAVDFLAIKEIIFLCLSGYSNKDIAKKFHMPMWYIEECIYSFLYFDGWYDPLEYNVYPLYDEEYENFYSNVIFHTYKLTDAYIKFLHGGISKYKKAERLLEQYD